MPGIEGIQGPGDLANATDDIQAESLGKEYWEWEDPERMELGKTQILEGFDNGERFIELCNRDHPDLVPTLIFIYYFYANGELRCKDLDHLAEILIIIRSADLTVREYDETPNILAKTLSTVLKEVKDYDYENFFIPLSELIKEKVAKDSI
jgi:hypothetical protein